MMRKSSVLSRRYYFTATAVVTAFCAFTAFSLGEALNPSSSAAAANIHVVTTENISREKVVPNVQAITFFRPTRKLESDDEDHDHSHDHDSHDDDHEEEEKKPWGKVILSTLIVNLAALSGILFLIPALTKKSKVPEGEKISESNGNNNNNQGQGNGKVVDNMVPSFACGALLSTTVFLIIPEAIHLLEMSGKVISEDGEHHDHRFLSNVTDSHDDHDDHADESLIAMKFGLAVLSGFLIPMILALIFPHATEDYRNDGSNNNDEEQATSEEVGVSSINLKLCLSILIGDGIHNFCDGIFIGVGFLLCSDSVAYTIMAMTLYHEIAQELSDYFLLTKHAGLTPLKALTLNFVSGLSVTLGGIIVLASNLSQTAIGVVLGNTAGVYIFIAACECLPRVEKVVKTKQDRWISLALFMVGAVPIGLTLLKHEHC